MARLRFLVPAALMLLSSLAPAFSQAISASLVPSMSAAEKDMLIGELMRRVDALERRIGTGQAPAPPSMQSQATSAEPPFSTVRPESRSAQQAVDDESSRALERTLVREGGLLLPKGTFELEPRLAFDHRSASALQLANVNGTAQLGQETARRELAELGLGLRMGLGSGTQFDIDIPYAHLNSESVIPGVRNLNLSRSGFGNVELGISKQLWDEGSGRPAALANVRYGFKADTGNPADADSLASRFSRIQAGLTLVKRLDPIVLFGAFGYLHQFARTIDGVDTDPGNAISFKAGSLLALNPESSMRFAFEVARNAEVKINGVTAPGTQQTAALLSLGYSFVLTPHTLLGIELGAGLTKDAPDFRMMVSLPVKF